jgi:3-methyladenine DNA glycosylase Tag
MGNISYSHNDQRRVSKIYWVARIPATAKEFELEGPTICWALMQAVGVVTDDIKTVST